MQLRTLAIRKDPLVTLSDVKDSLGFTWPDEVRDCKLATSTIPAAVKYVEDRIGVSLQQKTLEYIRYVWPFHCEPIELPRPPTLCVTEIVHATDCGDWTRIAEEDFRLQPSEEGMLIYPCDCWPSNRCHCATSCAVKVRVTYEAGYQTLGDVPANLCEGIMRIIAWLLNGTETDRAIGEQLINQQANLRAVGHYG